MKVPNNKTGKIVNTKVSTKATIKKIVASAAKAVKEKVRWTAKAVLAAMSETGCDFPMAWQGPRIDSKFCEALKADAEHIGANKKLPHTDKVLVVEGRVLNCFPLTGLGGDIYERAHSPKLSVRGSVRLLKQTYGEKHVHVVSRATCARMFSETKHKTDKGGRQRALSWAS